ncbi:glycosyltransferase [Psychrobacter namhaensis]|uniref:glycosyltransferase n=1 Tax=Psychrobacter namhaensis TaxID=292734 RepID=UPI003D0514C5
MKILFVITGLGMGGAEHVVSNLADELVKANHKVNIVYLTGEILVAPKNREVELISLGMNSPKDFLKAYIKLRFIVKSYKPDIVHSHMFHANMLSRLLRLSTKLPILVTTAHNTNEGGHHRILAYRLTDSLTNISTNVSKESVRKYIQKKAVKPGRMVTIPNGVDTDYFSFDELVREEKRVELNIGNKQLVLCVGSLTKQKDYPNLFRAVALLKNIRQDFKVFIVGDGPDCHSLKKLLESMGLEEYISFLGIRRDVKELMSAADIYAMSSAWEGLPMVILEAMSCENFVIATDCGGVSEVIGDNGLIVDIKNHTQLCTYLDKGLSMSYNQRLKVGKAARQSIIDDYSLNANVKAYLNLYSIVT